MNWEQIWYHVVCAGVLGMQNSRVPGNGGFLTHFKGRSEIPVMEMLIGE